MAEPGQGKSSPAAAPPRFQNVDADAVCEQCGTVNDEGTLICRVCGQNLRDQRTRRLAGTQSPAGQADKISRVRLFTGILSGIGILILVIVALSLPRIEASLTNALSEDPINGALPGDLGKGPGAAIYDELAADLRDYPSAFKQIKEALDKPVIESSYNGRYVLLRQGALTPERVVGEAALRRRGGLVYFVAQLTSPAVEVRGFARIEDIQGPGEPQVQRPVVRNTAGYTDEQGNEIKGRGMAEPIEAGGHRVMIMQAGEGADTANVQAEYFAYRLR